MTDTQATHEVCDVLVAGSGAGGFSAALTARLQGLDVIMVEKTPLFGGTTAYSSGIIWIPGNSHAAAANIKDSRDDALAYLRHHIGNRFDHANAEAFLDNAPAMLDLFEREGLARFSPGLHFADYHPDEPGASQGGRALFSDNFDGRLLGSWFDKLRPPLETMTALGGMMVGRNDLPHVFQMTRSVNAALHVGHMVARYARDRLRYARGTRLVNGNALIASLAVSAFARGIPLWLNSPIVDLVSNTGRIVGAIVERDGERQRIETRCGVVLACGGFPQNEDLKRHAYRHVAAGKSHVALPPSGNTGDGLRLAQAVGGTYRDDLHHPAAWAPASLVPQADGSVVPYPHFLERGKPGYISVNCRGRRFVNEATSYHVFGAAMIDACRDDDDVEAWIVCDHRAIRRFGLGALGPAPMRITPYLNSGYIKSSDTITGLAAACCIDAAGLERTIATFNSSALQGEDPEFHRGSDASQRLNGAAGHEPNPCVGPLDHPPFYAVRVIPSELGTYAGIRTNTNAQVVDSDGHPITGLYAVGNDAASIMGGTYPGPGISIGPAMTFGYIAACHIASTARQSHSG